MEYITDENLLTGKTIKSVKFVECNESIAILFSDESCAFVSGAYFGDCFDIRLAGGAEPHLERDAGIISLDQYESIMENKKKTSAENNKKRDLEQLAALQAKYGEES